MIVVGLGMLQPLNDIDGGVTMLYAIPAMMFTIPLFYHCLKWRYPKYKFKVGIINILLFLFFSIFSNIGFLGSCRNLLYIHNGIVPTNEKLYLDDRNVLFSDIYVTSINAIMADNIFAAFYYLITIYVIIMILFKVESRN
jgi:hypothetical protein